MQSKRGMSDLSSAPQAGKMTLGLKFFVAVCVVGVLSSCQGVPLLSTSGAKTDMNISELRNWAANEADKALAVLNLDGEWYDSLKESTLWGRDRELLLEEASVSRCGSGNGDLPGRLEITIQNMTFTGDVLRQAEKVRSFWESEGWEVSNVLSEPDSLSPLYFRADREDGALVAIDAASNFIEVSIYSACSNDPSMLR